MIPPLNKFQEEVKAHVIGQDSSVDVLTTVFYKYLMKMCGRDFGCYFSGSTTILLLGPSGTGKTYLTRTAAKIANLHFCEINCKSINQEGWAGGKALIDQITDFVNASWDNVNGAVFFLDEFDKILTSNTDSKGKDHHFHIQSSLLKYIEGMKIACLRQKLDTNNCLFVFAGAFSELLKKKQNTEKIMGFTGNTNKKKKKEIRVGIDDLIEYGMLPEIAGRMQEITILNPLSIKSFKSIVENEYFCYTLWKQVLGRLNIEFNPDTRKWFREAEKLDLGARGLVQLVEKEVTAVLNKHKDKIYLQRFDPV